MAESSNNDGPVDLTEKSLRVLLGVFHTRLNTNTELRAKHAEQPELFMDSEVDLHESITALSAISTNPLLFDLISTDTKVMNNLVSLLGHENPDICIAIIDVVAAMLEAPAVGEDETTSQERFADTLASPDTAFLRSLVRVLRSFDVNLETDAKAMIKAFEILENLLEPECMDSDDVLSLCKQTKLLELLFTIMQNTLVSPNERFPQHKLYAAELISVLVLAGGGPVSTLIATEASLGQFITLIAPYRRDTPQDDDEIEYVENLFQILQILLSRHAVAQTLFADHGGIELTILMARRKVFAGEKALLLLHTALENHVENCQKFVESAGLKMLFAALMKVAPGTVTSVGISEKQQLQEILMNAMIGILQSCLTLLADVSYLRVLRKFTEKSYEKVDKLAAVYLYYEDRVSLAAQSYDGKKSLNYNNNSKEEDDDDENENERFLALSEAGLESLETTALLFGLLLTAGDDGLTTRCLQLLWQCDSGVSRISNILQTHAKRLGATAQEVSEESKHLFKFLQGTLTLLAKIQL